MPCIVVVCISVYFNLYTGRWPPRCNIPVQSSNHVLKCRCVSKKDDKKKLIYRRSSQNTFDTILSVRLKRFRSKQRTWGSNTYIRIVNGR